MTARTNNGVAAYQRAMRELREKHRTEFDRLLNHYNNLARVDAHLRAADPGYKPVLETTPYNAAMTNLRDKQYREEFDELRDAIRAEMDGEVDAAKASILETYAIVVPDPEPEPATDCEGCRDKPYLDHISDEEHVRNDVGLREVERLQPEDICPCSTPGSTHSYALHDMQKASEQRIAERSMIPIESYSMALDEIYLLRAVLADEARILDGHLNFKAFPLSRRKIAEAQVKRMRGIAAGMFEEWAREDFDPKDALRSAEIDECMTRSQWEQQRKLGESA